MPCGLLGCGLDSIVAFIVSIVTFLGSVLWIILQLLIFLFNFLEILIIVVTNPYLLAMVIFTVGNVYVLVMAQTRKEIAACYGRYFSYAGKAIWTVMTTAYGLIRGGK